MMNRRIHLLTLAALAVASFMPIRCAYGQSAAAPSADKAPAVIYIIRHAEKPPPEENSSDLAPMGFKRAQALPSLFVQVPGAPAPRLKKPDAIFATARSKKSNRPVETITPLAEALKLPVLHEFEDKNTAGIAAEVLSGKYTGKVVLICWHHGEIPHLAAALGVSGAPVKWDDAVFNQVWKIEYMAGKAQLSTLGEGVLPGDLP